MSKVLTARVLKSNSPSGRMWRSLVKHSEGKGLRGVLVAHKTSGKLKVQSVRGPNYEVDWDSSRGKFVAGDSVVFDVMDFGKGVGVAFGLRRNVLRPGKR